MGVTRKQEGRETSGSHVEYRAVLHDTACHAFIVKMITKFDPQVKSEEALWTSVYNLVEC